MNQDWTRGQLSRAAKVTMRALRHYEHLGLVVPTNRTPGGHRLYSPDDIERLYRVLTLRQLDFSLGAIAALLGSPDGTSLTAMVSSQITRTDLELTRLRQLWRRLNRMRSALDDAAQPTAEQLLGAMEAMTVPTKLTRIYTRGGDEGETDLGDLTRAPKTSPRIEAGGDVDELTAHIGVALASSQIPAQYVTWLERIQNDLYDICADLSVPLDGDGQAGGLRISAGYTEWLEQCCDQANDGLEHLESFVIPEGSPATAHLHLCRTVCRRAERSVLKVADVNPEVARYLNRLSDLLFILSRRVGTRSESLWAPARHSA